jgi:PA domain
MKLRRSGVPGLLLIVLVGISVVLGAQGQAPTPGVVAGNFTTYLQGFLRTSPEAAYAINQYFALIVSNGILQPGGTGEFFHIGFCPTTIPTATPCPAPTSYAYAWKRTGTPLSVGNGNNAVVVDSGAASLVQALGTAGPPDALSNSATNPSDVGTAGILGVQALSLKINQGFSEVFVTPVTGFSGLSLVNMDGVKLDGTALTPAQVAELNGQATLQIRENTDLALNSGAVSYGLSFGQLTNLIDLLNGSFDGGQPSKFAKAHLYQPYITSSAFNGRRPSTVSVFAPKPTYNTFQGVVTSVGTGCVSSDYAGFPYGRIALIQRGGCTFQEKVLAAAAANATAAIIFNSVPEVGGACPGVPTKGSGRCEALVGMGAVTNLAPPTIPAAFVQRSTGLLLRDTPGPVTVFVQQ